MTIQAKWQSLPLLFFCTIIIMKWNFRRQSDIANTTTVRNRHMLLDILLLIIWFRIKKQPNETNVPLSHYTKYKDTSCIFQLTNIKCISYLTRKTKKVSWNDRILGGFCHNLIFVAPNFSHVRVHIWCDKSWKNIEAPKATKGYQRQLTLVTYSSKLEQQTFDAI